MTKFLRFMMQIVHPLPDSVNLPSARGTRQSPIYTRQRLCRVLHSANATRQKMGRQRRLCRVSFVRHSAKPLPSARHSAKLEPKKNPKKWEFLPKKNGNFFLSMEARTGQRPPIFDIFRVNFMATRPTRFEPETSRCARTSSTTTPHFHLCLHSVLVPNILY